MVVRALVGRKRVESWTFALLVGIGVIAVVYNPLEWKRDLGLGWWIHYFVFYHRNPRYLNSVKLITSLS